jgi:urease subunit alpha
MTRLSRRQYVELYGPTIGDRFRLADTTLICQIERDLLTPGDELVFGGGKTARDGMGQAPGITNRNGALDLVITNAIIMDPLLGIIKADIGVKDGLIAGIGKAGNPGVMDGVDPALVVGPGTEVIAGEHLIATPGGIDAHIHMISPSRCATPPLTESLPLLEEGAARPTAPGPPPALPVPGIFTGCWRRRKPFLSTGVCWAKAMPATSPP